MGGNFAPPLTRRGKTMICPLRKTVGHKEADCVSDCALRMSGGVCAITAIARKISAPKKDKKEK